ncbi:fumarylacetoacetate hydrolase family protein [Jatrophihabitans cynanchi]|jgi:2-keto-4-pentenoate hydratase/2-oxohepta-3-ene-1,7-dioic acid hydratase in catechol pathway|uniref:Fumarylacetoacetate hydrolase family protein n=1 Tax=Jatrophihabitans cynanchi TaxID=2944128 RepID=A0ABY7K3S8_9ACTN|nr:fumarylacetoacetate hydrolase family protein [Jatrophihabitans sp. SB3-54]WAX58282.1 fumarylacetoacetate hydrolase family protein [Jatrophihabitans sp. SB3-54]
MRLMRLGAPGQERAHLLVGEDLVVDVSAEVGDFDGRFFGSDALTALRRDSAGLAARAGSLSSSGLRVGAPVAKPEKIICIGLNYADHAAETGQALPTEPIVFAKAPNTLVGPNDQVRIPRGSTKTDWEVELGVVIGRQCRYLSSEQEALEAVAGYLVCNDVSEREFQLERGGQWIKGKSCETFNPAGPWLVTADEVPDPQALGLWLDVNGERRQTGNTATMIFGVGAIIAYLSRFMVLEPGDIINTGTPPGVAMGQREPRYLRAGDVVELGIDGLGRQRQECVAAP